MSGAPSKGRRIIPSKTVKTNSPTAALTTLGGHDARIANSKQKQKDVDGAIQKQKLTRKTTTEVLQDKSNAVKRRHNHTPASPGSVRAQKTTKVKVKDDQPTSRQRSATRASTTKEAILPAAPKLTKAPLPDYNELSDGSESNSRPTNEQEKSQHVELIVISDSDVPDSDSGDPSQDTPRNKAQDDARRVETKEAATKKEKKTEKAPRHIETPEPKETAPTKEKEKEKTRRIETPEPKETAPKKDKGKEKARRIETPEPKETAPKKDKGKEKARRIETPEPKETAPKKDKGQVINSQTCPNISRHMSGSRLETPTTFTNNAQANTYYAAVGAGSITAASHAAMHALHIQILALEDSMRRTAIEEERLNLELVRANRPTMSFPGFLPQDLHDLSVPLRLLGRFRRAEASAFAGNQTLSVFGMVREATSDRTAFPMPVIVPTEDFPECRMSSQDEEDRGEGTSSGQHQRPASPEFEGEGYYEDDD